MTIILLLVTALALSSVPATAQTVSVSPSVIQLQGRVGQSTTQRLTLVNTTDRELSFVLEAADVVVVDGRRRFVPAGDVPGSIAATAVFVPDALKAQPGEHVSTTVTLTVPGNAAPRAVVALFKSISRLTPDGRTNIALGTLLTFTLPGSVELHPEATHIASQSPTSNLIIEQPFTNIGSEPATVRGLLAIIDARGLLTGRALFTTARALPGERISVRADFPSELAPGRYRAVLTFDAGNTPLTMAREVDVP